MEAGRPCCLALPALGQPADQGLGPVGDVGVERQHRFGPDDALDPEDLAEGGLQVVGVGGHHAAPDVPPAGDLVDLQDLGEQPQGRHHAVQLPVRHLDRDESDDVVPHRLEVDLAAAVVQHAGAEQAPDARLCRVAGNAQRVAEFADLDAGIADEFQQDLQVGGVKSCSNCHFRP